TDYVGIAHAGAGLTMEANAERLVIRDQYGYIRVHGGEIHARGGISAFTLHADGITKAWLNGIEISTRSENGYVSYASQGH
ncbi:MAG: hypothetical protein AAB263_00340, partial [Planctomycetota bacterium]